MSLISGYVAEGGIKGPSHDMAELQRLTTRFAYTTPFSDPRFTIKRTSSRQASLEALFHLYSNSICVSRRKRAGKSHSAATETITP
jgi:hypothetical protein